MFGIDCTHLSRCPGTAEKNVPMIIKKKRKRKRDYSTNKKIATFVQPTFIQIR
jgi:hypothetical protein